MTDPDQAALRALQNRLTERLSLAGAEASSTQWLAVQMGSRHCLLALELAGEIFPCQGITTVPYTVPWFWGVANLRGQLLGVVDVATLLGEPAPRSDSALAHISLLALHPALQVQSALVVDRLLGLRHPQELTRHTQTASGVAASELEQRILGATYTDSAGVVWQELHLQALAQLPQFTEVQA